MDEGLLATLREKQPSIYIKKRSDLKNVTKKNNSWSEITGQQQHLFDS